jgi:hypothetical protein
VLSMASRLSWAAVLLASSVAWGDTPTTAFLGVSAVDAEVPPSVAPDLATALRDALAHAQPLLPAAQVEALQSGAASEPDLTEVRGLVATAKSQALELKTKDALKSLKTAKDKLQALQLQLRDFQPVCDVLLETAVASLSAGPKGAKDALAALKELARIRPDYRIDAAQFPPGVIATFEKARQLDARTPRGRLSLKSTPPGAKVFVDGLPQGQTPATLPLSPGPHVVRVEAPGYSSWVQALPVQSYAKVEKPVTLERNAALDGLTSLATAAGRGSAPAEVLKLRGPVSDRLGVRGVLVGAVGLDRDGYVVTALFLPKAGTAHAVVQTVDRELKNVAAVASQLADELTAKGRSPGFEPTVDLHLLSSPAPVRELDFAKYAFGMQPNVTALSLLPKQAVQTSGAAPWVPDNKQPETPVVTPSSGSHWWLWTGLGLVVAAAAGGTAYYLVSHNQPAVDFTLTRVP